PRAPMACRSLRRTSACRTAPCCGRSRRGSAWGASVLLLDRKIFLRAFLRALRVLAVSARLQFNRQGEKDAKKTRRRTVWFRRIELVALNWVSLSGSFL